MAHTIIRYRIPGWAPNFTFGPWIKFIDTFFWSSSGTYLSPFNSYSPHPVSPHSTIIDIYRPLHFCCSFFALHMCHRYEYAVSLVHAVNNLAREMTPDSFVSVCHRRCPRGVHKTAVGRPPEPARVPVLRSTRHTAPARSLSPHRRRRLESGEDEFGHESGFAVRAIHRPKLVTRMRTGRDRRTGALNCMWTDRKKHNVTPRAHPL